MRNRIIKYVIGVEGEYVNHSDDPGGKTRYGITEDVARRHGYGGAMKSLPLSLALEIYKVSYWDKINLDAVCMQSPLIAFELFDSGVNVGTGKASMWLQLSLNKLNRKGEDYSDLKVDGSVGGKTLMALESFLSKRPEGEKILFNALNCFQGYHYLILGDWSESFTNGWMLHRVGHKPKFLEGK